MKISEDDRRIYSNISISLCTFDGELYINELLKSLSEQTLLPDELVVCDDVSTDNTVELIEVFSKEAPFLVRIHINEKRLGVVQNFAKAIKLCSHNYIALCDQDDIWLPDKLEKSIIFLQKAEQVWGKETPLLLHSDLTVVDAEGEIISPSFMKMRKIKHSHERILNGLLVQNFVTGCTVVANWALVEKALPIPDKVIMHDWWLAQIAAGEGSIIFVKEPLVLYRQHRINVLGAKKFFSADSISRLLHINYLEAELAAAIIQAVCLKNHFKDRDYNENNSLGLVDKFINDTVTGGFRAIRTALMYGILKQGLLRNIIYIFLLLKGGYRRFL